MTGPVVPLSRLGGHLPVLVGRAGVVALVPVDPAASWAAETAWEVARQAAALGRRTLLVDCFVDAPRLHSAVGAPGEDGIVDAFEYGASLNRIAQRQPGTELFFVPTGTFAADPAALLANPRWPRLAAGFRHEGALLMLYVPSAALPTVAPWTDAMIVVAPEGFDVRHDVPGGIVEAEQIGKPLLVVTPGGPPAPAGPGPAFTGPAAPTAFEVRPSVEPAATFDFTPSLEPAPAFDLTPTVEEAPVFDLAGKEEEKPVFEIVEEEPASPFEIVPDEPPAEPADRLSLQLPAAGEWELPTPATPPAGATGQPAGGYAPSAYEPPPAPASGPSVGGYAPTAFEPDAGGFAPAGFDASPTPPPPAAPEGAADAAAAEAAPPEDEEARLALRRRPPLAELAALRAPPRTRRTLLHAGGFIVSVWLVMAALRPVWVLPIPQAAEAPPPAPRRGEALLTDSLPWIVQVSAWNDLPHAFEAMDTLAARGVHAFVTPLQVGRSLSYRVQAGPFATMREAEALLDTLRAASLADPDGSAAVALPLSFLLGTPSGASADQMRADRDSLRAGGVAAFLLTEPGGRLRLYAGAFEHAAQTAVLDSVLFTLRRARRLGTRVGSLP